MGYDIATPFSNKDKQRRMLNFLKKEFRTLNELTESREYLYVSSKPETERELFMSPKRLPIIGFHYNSSCSSIEREYAWNVCTWMAIQDGARTRTSTGKRPYIFYDNEKIVLVEDKESEKSEGRRVVDRIGFHPLSLKQKYVDYSGEFHIMDAKEVDKANRVLRAELERLTELYQTIMEQSK